MIASVRTKAGELCDAGIVAIDSCFGWFAGLGKLAGMDSKPYDKFSWLRGATPNGNRMCGWLSQHRAMREPDGIPVSKNRKKEHESQR